MPTDKDFKRVVRDRMKKTGESYTTARAQLLRAKPAPSKRRARVAKATSAAAPTDYAKLAGMSDASVEKATGCRWESWVKALDYAKADTWTHKEIAQYVHTKFKVPDWWTQTVTVGYERIKGLRVRGQRRDGTYEVSKSKVFAVPVARLFDAVNDAPQRATWLTDAKAELRHATPIKSARLRWPDGSVVDVGFFSKGSAKSQLTIGHRKLKSSTHAARMKSFWTEKLRLLDELLTSRQPAEH